MSSALPTSFTTYVPSWQAKAPRPAAPAPPPPAPTAPAAVPPASKMTVTRTTTNFSAAVPPTPPAPSTAPSGFTTSYTYGSSASRTASTNLGPAPSPGLRSIGGSPSLAKRFPTRMSPAVTPVIGGRHMNPNASEFIPGQGLSGGGAAGGLDALPTSTADLEAARDLPIPPPPPPARSPAWQPSYKRLSAATSPALAPVSLDAKSQAAIDDISRRSALKAEAPAYVPGRTLNRLTLSRPSPLVLAQDPQRSSLDMQFDDLWSLFYLPADFGESIKEETYNPTLIFRIDNIPTFWKVFNNIAAPTTMQRSTLYLFKDGIDPKWEDPANRDGGMVKVKVSGSQVDEAWELLLCKTVGDSWTPAVRNTINGVALKVRDRFYLLEVWVTKETPELMSDIAALWQGTLGGAFAVTYYSHEAMQSKAAAAATAAATAEKQRKQNLRRRF